MKVEKRDCFTNPVNTVPIWLVPFSTYLFMKGSGVVHFNKMEFIWWITIPVMFFIWLIVNFKIVRGDK